jgi:hypothetical protein
MAEDLASPGSAFLAVYGANGSVAAPGPGAASLCQQPSKFKELSAQSSTALGKTNPSGTQ